MGTRYPNYESRRQTRIETRAIRHLPFAHRDTSQSLSSPPRQRLKVTADQGFTLRSAPSLHLFFCRIGLANVGELSCIDKSTGRRRAVYWAPSPSL